MKRTAMRKVGTVGQANINSRKKIAEIAEEKCLDYCEIGFPDCLHTMYLAPAHRHKRAWYKGDEELLADYKQWLSLCVKCHDKIEFDEELTEQEFIRLRGSEE